MSYSTDERVDMLLVFGECHRDEKEAARVYAERYPERRHPVPKTFRRTEQRLRETGSLNERKHVRRRTAGGEETEVFVLGAVAMDPHCSTRDIAAVAGVSKSTVCRILQRNKFHPYHISLSQELHGNDFDRRLNFCRDESNFSNRGEVNRHNMHYWSAQNPHWLRQVDHQRRWSLNVWCGILGDNIIGPYFIDGTLTAERYELFLRNELGVLLDDIGLDVRRNMWFQHDGAPAHSSNRVVDLLHTKWPGRWIGQRGPLDWPPRSPDFKPIDFFLWSYVKERVFTREPTTPEDMRLRIEEACHSITPESLLGVRREFRRRVGACLEVNGRVFEHLL